MEVVRAPETAFHLRTTLRYIPYGSNNQFHRSLPIFQLFTKIQGVVLLLVSRVRLQIVFRVHIAAPYYAIYHHMKTGKKRWNERNSEHECCISAVCSAPLTDA
jgi:hypothetical protein